MADTQLLVQYDERGASQLSRANSDVARSFAESKEQARGSTEMTLIAADSMVSLGKEAIAAGKALLDFAADGAKAAAITESFTGNLTKLREASAKTVDKTTLQELSFMSKELGLQQRQLDGILRKAATLADQSVGTTAENARAILNGEAEAMRKLGIVIDRSAPRFAGLSEEQKKLAATIEVANEGLDLQVDSLDSAATKMAQTQTSMADLESTMAEATNTFLTSAGILDGLGESAEKGESSIGSLASGFGTLAGIGLDVADYLYPVTDGLELAADAANYASEGWERLTGGSIELRGELDKLEAKVQESGTDVLRGFGQEIRTQHVQTAQLTTAYINMSAALDDIRFDAAKGAAEALGDEFERQVSHARELQRLIEKYERDRKRAAQERKREAEQFAGGSAGFFTGAVATGGGAGESQFGGFGAGFESELSSAVGSVQADTALPGLVQGAGGGGAGTGRGVGTGGFGGVPLQQGSLDDTQALISQEAIKQARDLADALSNLRGEFADMPPAIQGMGAALESLGSQSELIVKATQEENQALGILAGVGLKAGRAAAGAAIKNKRKRSGVLAAFYGAESIASFAMGNVPQGIGLASASAAHIAVAAGAGESSGGSSRGGAGSSSRASGPTALSTPVSQLGGRERQSQTTNFFNITYPNERAARELMGAMNGVARDNTGHALSSALLRAGATNAGVSAMGAGL